MQWLPISLETDALERNAIFIRHVEATFYIPLPQDDIHFG